MAGFFPEDYNPESIPLEDTLTSNSFFIQNSTDMEYTSLCKYWAEQAEMYAGEASDSADLAEYWALYAENIAINFEVIVDTSPQLGGDLDVNGFNITSAGNNNIAITPDGSGTLILDGLNWPQADGVLDQVLGTNGLGDLVWAYPLSGAVDSIFGRSGDVIAASGDYNSDLVLNFSTITGTTITDALETLGTGLSTALQPGDNVSELINDAGYLLDITAESIGDLSDVDITGVVLEDGLKWNGSSFVVGSVQADLIEIGGYTELETSNPTIDGSLNNFFKVTQAGVLVFTISNVPVGAYTCQFEILCDGVSPITWPTGVTWVVGSEPLFMGLGDILQVTLTSTDNGSTWTGSHNLGEGSGTVSPLTTKGDVYTYSTTDARLGVGTDGFVLSADSGEATGLKWIAAGAAPPVDSVFGRSGVVVAVAGDYSSFYATTAQGALADTAVQPTDSVDVLADVDLTGLATNDILRYNGSNFAPFDPLTIDYGSIL